MLSPRYTFDGAHSINLSQDQLRIRDEVNRKVADGTYRTETVPCCVCGSTDGFLPLAQKDRYGLFMSVVLCRTCGLVQTNPRMNQEAYTQFYNKEYRGLYAFQTPEELYESENNASRGFAKLLKAEGLITKPFEKLSVLEVGCGVGGLLGHFRDLGCRTKGIDLDAGCCDFGRRNYGLDLESCAITDVSTEMQADLIIYNHVLEHILEPAKELSAIRERLADDGLLLVIVPGIKNIHDSYGDFLLYLQNAHVYHFTLRTLISLMHANGFRIAKGSEHILSVFRKDRNSDTEMYVSDYRDVLEYLNRIENETLCRISCP